VLRTHLRMTGRWDLYRPGERWRRPGHLARAVIEVDGAVAVCFAAPVVELTRAADGTATDRLPGVDHLGPDLCREDADLAAAVANMAAADPAEAVAEVLLDQSVAAGVGNVYKSEVLWACRVHPLTPLAEVDEPARAELIDTAAALLRRNLGRGPRTTIGAAQTGALAVYRRARCPCPRCGTPIAQRRTGPQQRITYWCPQCQPAPGTGEDGPRRRG
jgi:endonuclease-8